MATQPAASQEEHSCKVIYYTLRPAGGHQGVVRSAPSGLKLDIADLQERTFFFFSLSKFCRLRE
jgi:hypothetical protein